MYARHTIPIPSTAFSVADLEDPSSGPILDMADPARDSRIAIVGPGGLDLACKLIRLGYSTASVVRLDDRVRAHEADVVIIPQPASADALERAIPLARRMLTPLGVVVLRLAADRSDALCAWARNQLILNGFTAVRVDTAHGETLLGAELPLHGRL